MMPGKKKGGGVGQWEKKIKKFLFLAYFGNSLCLCHLECLLDKLKLPHYSVNIVISNAYLCAP